MSLLINELAVSRYRAFPLPSASFSMCFEDTGGDIGFARTLNSNFVANQARDAWFGELP